MSKLFRDKTLLVHNAGTWLLRIASAALAIFALRYISALNGYIPYHLCFAGLLTAYAFAAQRITWLKPVYYTTLVMYIILMVETFFETDFRKDDNYIDIATCLAFIALFYFRGNRWVLWLTPVCIIILFAYDEVVRPYERFRSLTHYYPDRPLLQRQSLQMMRSSATAMLQPCQVYIFSYKACGWCYKASRALEEVLPNDRITIVNDGAIDSIADAYQSFEYIYTRLPMAYDREGAMNKAYGVRLWPTLLVTNREGRVVFTQEGSDLIYTKLGKYLLMREIESAWSN